MKKIISYGFINILHVFDILGLTRERVQTIMGHKQINSGVADIEFIKRRIEKGIENIKAIQRSGESFHSIIEFGTGSHGIDIVLFRLMGADKITTVDINNHLDFSWLTSTECLNSLRVATKELPVNDGKSNEKLLQKLKEVAPDRDQVLGVLNCKFLNFEDMENKSHFYGPYDLWYSESNLQRIPIKKILSYFEVVIKQLRAGGVAFHRVDFGDIFTQPHWPFYIENLGRFDFLSYGNLFWGLINRESYGSQNRLRSLQVESMFEALGLIPIIKQYVVYKDDEIRYGSVKFADQFSYVPKKHAIVAHARYIYTKSTQSQYEEEWLDYLPENW